MKIYTSASNARRAAESFASHVKGYKIKNIRTRAVNGGHVAAVVFETTRERVLNAVDDGDAMNDAKIGIIGLPRKRSSVKAPCLLVWDIADEIVKAGKGARKDVIAAAVEKGVNVHTARTQYQRWFEAQNA